jgi:uncharacterized protein (DUF1501 family)
VATVTTDPLLDPGTDPARLAPDPLQAAVRVRVAQVDAERRHRSEVWGGAASRRRFLAGAGAAAGLSALGQLATVRASFGAAPGTGALVVVFLRGGMDGLSVLVPADDPHLAAARPDIALPGSALLPLTRGFGLHPALGPLHPLWGQGRLVAVPAVATPDVSRSHFQAQDCLERGGAGTGTAEGWLDRVLDRLGPGTTFRAVGSGATVPRALAGDQRALALSTLEDFRLGGWEGMRAQTVTALRALYTGFDHPLTADVATTLDTLDLALLGANMGYRSAASYPPGPFGEGLATLAQLVKSDAGLRVASIDLGGWDSHVNHGAIDHGMINGLLTSLAGGLAAFAADLGDRIDDVTVVTMTEFGRRVAQNANRGTDHGHGGVALLLGGGLAGGTIPGTWQGLAPDGLDDGDVPGWNDYRDVLGEVVTRRLGLGAADLAAVFPGHTVRALGVTR